MKYSSKNLIKEIDKYIEFSIGKIEIPEIGTKADFFNKFKEYHDVIIQIIGNNYGEN